MVEPQREHRVARLEEPEVHGHVRLRARVRLDVRVLGAEQLLRTVDRELLDLVHDLATAVVPASGISLGVLVREDGADRLEHRRPREVLRRDQLDLPALTVGLTADQRCDLGIVLGEPPGPQTFEVVGGNCHSRDPTRLAPVPVSDFEADTFAYATRRAETTASMRRSTSRPIRAVPADDPVGLPVARADEVVPGACEHHVAARPRQGVVVARAAHEHVVPAATDEHVRPSETADHVAPPGPHEPVGPVRAHDRAAEEAAVLVARPRRRPEGGGRPRRSPGDVPGHDAEGVARAGSEPRDAERDAARPADGRQRQRSRTGDERAAPEDLDPDARLEPARRDVGVDPCPRERDARDGRAPDHRDARGAEGHVGAARRAGRAPRDEPRVVLGAGCQTGERLGHGNRAAPGACALDDRRRAV